MRFLRYVVGYTLWKKKKSGKIRSQLGNNKLDEEIHERKTDWLKYLQIMSPERVL
jgi:hypothetical protein